MSIVYQNHGILFFAPTSSNLNLTIHKFKYVFRLSPSNKQMAIALAAYCDKVNYKKIIVLHGRTPYAIELADIFIFNMVERYNHNIILHRSFFESRTDFTDLLVELKEVQQNEGFDAIFIAAGGSVATKLYEQSRNMNILEPFVGGESINSKIFWNVVKEWEDNDSKNKTVALTIFDEKKENKLVKKFIQTYEEKYQVKPEGHSAIGYDSIKLLAHGIKKAGSKVPIKIAEALRYMHFCLGITGTHKFKYDGDLFDKQLYVKFVQANGQFGYNSIGEGNTNDFIEECGNIDFDNDDIPNGLDACPRNTALEISQGVYQTGRKRGCPADNDKDGYLDYQDNCLDTQPDGLEKGIDEHGCPVDTDKDKVPDYKDKCPDGLLNYTQVNEDGCVLDED
ncbi:ABC transporter substrate-binding protein, partial [Thiotrichales bacterium HSG1]|nr:ABC transporter substrate-binding protein [Thiotrichales bacterium HSG1]